MLSACQQNVLFDLVVVWGEKKNLEWEENHKIFWELTNLLSFIACCDTVIPCLANSSVEIVVALLPPLK